MSQNIGPEAASPAASALGPRTRVVLTVVWCAFLAAALATMVFFAGVDPAAVVHSGGASVNGGGASVNGGGASVNGGVAGDRTMLYSLGFLFLWATSALAAALTAWLIVGRAPDSRT